MATKAQVNKFIEELGKLAVNERNTRIANGKGWVLPSLCIAQAALETGWGTAAIMVNANAYFGVKATKSWKGKVYSAQTKECYDGVNYVDITDCFRAYDSKAESVSDYYNLICENERYKAAVNNGDALSAITAIKNGGYATSPTYIENVMSIIDDYGLTSFDKLEEKTESTILHCVGESVEYTSIYTSSDSTEALKPLYTTGTITKVLEGARNPYLIGDSTGWVNDECIVSKSVSVEPIKKGDKVKVLKNINYDNGQGFVKWHDVYEVIEVEGNRAVIGVNGVTTSAIDVKYIEKI